MVSQSHFLLICDSIISSPALIDGVTQPAIGLGRWNFVLERIDGSDRLEAQDSESYIHQDRLALLAVVRGLEALEQSSTVRLVTTSRYVDRGIRFGLPNWRETAYQWESFGVRKPVRNADLWRRVDVAMQYHEIACRLLKSSIAESEQDSAEIETAMPGGATSTPKVAILSDLANDSIPQAVVGPSQATQVLPSVLSAAVRTSNRNTELVARFMPNRVAYRVDSAHRLATPHLPKLARETSVSKPTKLQWWEMAVNWESPAKASSFPQAACGG